MRAVNAGLLYIVCSVWDLCIMWCPHGCTCLHRHRHQNRSTCKSRMLHAVQTCAACGTSRSGTGRMACVRHSDCRAHNAHSHGVRRRCRTLACFGCVVHRTPPKFVDGVHVRTCSDQLACDTQVAPARRHHQPSVAKGIAIVDVGTLANQFVCEHDVTAKDCILQAPPTAVWRLAPWDSWPWRE